MTSGGAHAETRRMMETAIRRLNVLEWVILGVAMALALLAGWLAAWLVVNVTGAPFRLTWAVSSLLFFIVPGWTVLRRERRAANNVPDGDITEERDDGGR
jgi:cobalamin biosynthesis protein CobD/CbiB